MAFNTQYKCKVVGQCRMEEEDQIKYTYYYTFYRSYKCYDSYNNLVAQPSVNGASAGIAASVGASVTATLNFKYWAVVGAGDECRIYHCIAYVSNGAQSPYTCQQSAGAGTYGYTSRAVTLPSNSPGNRYYSYWISTGSYSLSNTNEYMRVV